MLSVAHYRLSFRSTSTLEDRRDSPRILGRSVAATVDHLVASISGGGLDSESNSEVTTSMARQQCKGEPGSLKELGWTLHPPGDVQRWDGLVSWFLDYHGGAPRRWMTSATVTPVAACRRNRGSRKAEKFAEASDSKRPIGGADPGSWPNACSARRSLRSCRIQQPRVINTDQARLYGSAISRA